MKEEEQTVRYLNIGCGSTILPSPWENLDGRDLPGVNHVSTIDKLDFPDNTFDMIYASHVIEHIKRNDIETVLKEWVRVLKVDGVLRLSTPDFEKAIKIYQKCGHRIENVLGLVVGGQTYEYECHYMIYDKRSLTLLLEKCGLTAVHKWSPARVSHGDVWDYSQACTWEIPVSLNLEARKTNTVLGGKNVFSTWKTSDPQGDKIYK